MYVLGIGFFPQNKIPTSSCINTVLGFGTFEEIWTQPAASTGIKSVGFHRYCGARETETGVGQVKTHKCYCSYWGSAVFLKLTLVRLWQALFVNIQRLKKLMWKFFPVLFLCKADLQRSSLHHSGAPTCCSVVLSLVWIHLSVVSHSWIDILDFLAVMPPKWYPSQHLISWGICWDISIIDDGNFDHLVRMLSTVFLHYTFFFLL